MARLPTPGGDVGEWGNVLNKFLLESHNSDGSLRAIPQSKVSDLSTDIASINAALTKLQDQYLLVQSASDLEPYRTGDAYILPENTLVLLNGTVNIGSNYIAGAAGTVIRGFADANLISTNTSGVIRYQNTGSNVILREFNVICSAGPAFVLEETVAYQLNMFFVGIIGVSAGTITGFDVQSIKACYINASSGFTHHGATNKIFIHETPYYSISTGNAAITLAADVNATVVDFVTCFFKFSDGVCVEAEAGYTVGEGLLRGCLVVGTPTVLSGLTVKDVNWSMTDNSGIKDSMVVGEFHSDNNALTTSFAGVDTAVRINASTVSGDHLERFSVDGAGGITYTGKRDDSVIFMASITVNPAGNNIDGTVYFAVNDTVITRSSVPFSVSSGADWRTVNLMDIISLTNGDTVTLWIANNSNTNDIAVTDITLVAKG